MATGQGNGTTVTFGTTVALNTLCLLRVSRSGFAADDVETTCMGTSGALKTFEAGGFVDGGEYTLEVQYDPSVNIDATVGLGEETLVVDWAGSGDTDAYNVYVKGITDKAASINELMTASIALKVAGETP